MMTTADYDPDTGEVDGSAQRHSSRSLEISNAMARLHKQFVGRGPTNTRTTIDGDLVVCLLEGGYTQAEQTLANNDRSDLVNASREALQASMRPALVAAVQEAIGRRVMSFMSTQDIERNLQAEVFVLMPQHADGSAGPG